jgi:hypothetical protein
MLLDYFFKHSRRQMWYILKILERFVELNIVKKIFEKYSPIGYNVFHFFNSG